MGTFHDPCGISFPASDSWLLHLGKRRFAWDDELDDGDDGDDGDASSSGDEELAEPVEGLKGKTTWWLIPLSKWVITPVINGISRVNPLITGVITHLLSGMSHQVWNKTDDGDDFWRET